MELLLIRHGEIFSNVKKIYAGKSTEGLTKKGVCQAEEVAKQLEAYKISNIYSSPIERALQTANIISVRIGIGLMIDDSFQEMELGPWEGLSEDYVAQLYPEEWQQWMRRPANLKMQGRETLEELLKRVLTGVNRICQKTGDKTIVVVTHVAIIRVLLLWDAKKSLNLYKTIIVPNAKVFKIRINCLGKL